MASRVPIRISWKSHIISWKFHRITRTSQGISWESGLVRWCARMHQSGFPGNAMRFPGNYVKNAPENTLEQKNTLRRYLERVIMTSHRRGNFFLNALPPVQALQNTPTAGPNPTVLRALIITRSLSLDPEQVQSSQDSSFSSRCSGKAGYAFPAWAAYLGGAKLICNSWGSTHTPLVCLSLVACPPSREILGSRPDI